MVAFLLSRHGIPAHHLQLTEALSISEPVLDVHLLIAAGDGSPICIQCNGVLRIELEGFTLLRVAHFSA